MSSKPKEYISGTVRFYELDLVLNQNVLIPRVESEFLVEHALEKIQSGVVLDLCCGSGCLGLAIKNKRPSCHVVLSDISEKALQIAQKNASLTNLDVEIVCGDLLDPHEGRLFDFVICNPPYVSESEYETLSPSVKDYEPKIALVGGVKGLSFYERLAVELPLILKKGGWAFFEIGYQQGEAVEKIFATNNWSFGEVKKDLAGHDRFFIVQRGV